MNVLQFLHRAGKLKNVPRTGWCIEGILGESVAEHTFRTTLIATLKAMELGLDVGKVAVMALIHDLVEAVIGDVTEMGWRKIGKEKKKDVEREVFREMTSELPDELREKLRKIHSELINGESREAKLVIASDKLEMVLQAYEYSLDNRRRLDRFKNAMNSKEVFEFFPNEKSALEELWGKLNK